jgi:type II secretory pathway pseudopilin PulG
MRGAASQRGFTYLGLIILVTIIGLVGAATIKVDALLRRAAAEEELLEVGAAFSEALRSYASVTPRGQPTQPPTLKELLKDPRFPEVRRHLRKVFIDPLTGKAEWGIVYAGDRTGVLAVYSLSDAKPLKIANFDARFQGFENKEHISDWKFTASGQGVMKAELIADGRAGSPRSAPPPAPQSKPGEQTVSSDPVPSDAPPPVESREPAPEQEPAAPEEDAKLPPPKPAPSPEPGQVPRPPEER